MFNFSKDYLLLIWGLGIGDGGLGIGDWDHSRIPNHNTQYPIPNPQSPNLICINKT